LRQKTLLGHSVSKIFFFLFLKHKVKKLKEHEPYRSKNSQKTVTGTVRDLLKSKATRKI
jgi:hypothetical protein